MASLIFLVRDFEWLNTPEFAWSGRIAKVYDWDHPPSVTVNVLHQLGLNRGKRIGVEKQCFFYTVEEHETLMADMPENQFLDATHILWDARMIKSPDEIEVMRRSAALVDKAMLAGYEATRAGSHRRPYQCRGQCDAVREWRGIYGAAALRARRRASRACRIRPAAATGCKRDDVMYFEISASQHRYCAALMRTIFLGKPKDEWIDARQGLHRCSRCGARSDQAGRDAASRPTRRRAPSPPRPGFGAYHRNRLGYSHRHQLPAGLGRGRDHLAAPGGAPADGQPGMTFHMPLLCLKYREFGIGFSESIVVTESGCRKLSKLPAEIIIKR